MAHKFSAKKLLIAISVVLIPIVILLAIRMIQTTGSTEIYIFSDISECENLRLYAPADAIYTSYNTPSADVAWDDYEYVGFYGANFKSDNLSFEIFAYQYKDIETAKNYYRNAERKDPVSDTCFEQSTHLGGMVTLTVIDKNNVYHVQTDAKDRKELMDFLKKCFSVSVVDKLREQSSIVDNSEF